MVGFIEGERPVYGLQSPALSGDGHLPESIEEWTALYAAEICRICPDGPYCLIGWSMGGVIAHEMAVQLQVTGAFVSSLTLLDAHVSIELSTRVDPRAVASAALQGGGIAGDSPMVDVDYLTKPCAVTGIASGSGALNPEAILEGISHSFDVPERHPPRFFDGDLMYVEAGNPARQESYSVRDWNPFVGGRVHRHLVDVDHLGMTGADACARIGPLVAAWTAGGKCPNCVLSQ